MMKRSVFVVVLAFGAAFGTSPIAAEVLLVRAQVQGGGAGGQGIAGAQMDNAFHAGAAGATYGALVGAEVLFLDFWVEHNQYTGSNGLIGTWTQFMTGLDVDIDIGAKRESGISSMYAEAGVGIGFGVGTGQQVELPLDNRQVTDKAFLVQAQLGIGYRLNKYLSLGLLVPVQTGYMFKSGPGVVANDEGTHYQSVQAAALLNLRLDIKLK